jgi:hypothetical protein
VDENKMPLFERVKCRNIFCKHNISGACDFYNQKEKAKTLCPIQDIIEEVQ